MKKKTSADRSAEARSEGIRREKRRRALTRIQKKREEEKSDASRERDAVFTKKLADAPARRAPLTRRTRGYYRFSKVYPAKVDEKGMRENADRKSHRRTLRLIWALGVVLVFCCAYMLTRAAVLISRIPAAEAPATPETTEAGPGKLVRVGPEAGDADAVAEAVRAQGGTTALFEFKAEDGVISAGRAPLVAALKKMDIPCAAYISCFKDSAAPKERASLSVLRTGGEGGRWTDNAGNGWLNPFSEAAREYVLQAVEDASQEGFAYIVLDNVCFPTDSGSAPAFYEGEKEYIGTRNQLLRGFVFDAVQRAGAAQTVLMLRSVGLEPGADPERAPYYGNLLETSAAFICADARLSVQQKNVTVNGRAFDTPGNIPFAFMLAVGELAEANAGETRVLLCFDADENADEGAAAADYTHTAGLIYW